MQVPGGARDAVFDFLPGPEIDVAGAAFGPVFHYIGAAPENLAMPVAAKHGSGGDIDRGQIHADGAHQECGRCFVAASQQHAAIGGVGAQQFLGLHGEEVAVHHGGGLLKSFAESNCGHLHRETAGLPNAALHVVGPLPEMAVARIDVAPGVDDGDDGLAGIISLDTTHRGGP